MKILIVSKEKKILYDALVYSFEREQIEYEWVSNLKGKISQDYSNIIYINYDNKEDLLFLSKVNTPVIVISNYLELINNENTTINYILTPLVSDASNYTSVQKEYLYQKGIYNIIINRVYEFINNDNQINGLVVDTSNCKTKVNEWVFKFDSIAETYAWLSRKNISDHNFVEKVVNFYHEKIYNDSSKEINYLADKIENIQNGFKLIDIFICTRKELEFFKTNYFFKLLLKNISDTYKIYIVNRDELKEEEPFIYNKLLDGVAIYDDCVYIDTYDDEYSLGKVDCNMSTIVEYNKYFDYVVDKYGVRINTEDDTNGL